MTLGLPDTLPPLNRHALRRSWGFAAMATLVLLLGLFPALRPAPRFAPVIALLWLSFPAWGLYRYLTRKSGMRDTADRHAHGSAVQVSVFAVVMIGGGFVFHAWARGLGIASPLVFAMLLIFEGLAGVIVSLTEWWRLSHIGLSLGLMAGGFFLPLAGNASVGIPVGASALVGCVAGAAILQWQIHRHERLAARSNGL